MVNDHVTECFAYQEVNEMNIPNENEFNTMRKPEKPFMLISQVKRTCDYMVTWHETEDDLLGLARSNKAAIPIKAIEIGECRSVDLDDIVIAEDNI